MEKPKIINLAEAAKRNQQLLGGKHVLTPNRNQVVRIYAMDPGETTGFCDVLLDTLGARLLVRNGLELTTLDHLSMIFHPALFTHGGHLLFKTIVVCEHVHPHVKGFNPYPIEVMGIIKFLANAVGLPIELQSPGMMEAARKRHPLREIRSNHVRDAAHHAIAWAYKEHKDILSGTLEVEVEEETRKKLKSVASREAATKEYFSQFAVLIQGVPPKVEI